MASDEELENELSVLKQSIDSSDCVPNPPAEDPFEDVMACIYGEEVPLKDKDDSDEVFNCPSKATTKQA